ncbi:MAG: HAMP domain-containing histidine kinase [Bdellovibrionales bacterium]|nr:HAMP domain-containing histidine kinase [Bdellovibrionales bacterium]
MSSHPSIIVSEVMDQLLTATSMPAISRAVAEGARRICGADGATFILRDGDKCYYMDENAISPLWMGRRFPMEACISGWSMIHRETVLIEDIYEDARIPHEAYRPTFVRSLCMVPIRVHKPLGAIGTYWSDAYAPAPEEVHLLEILANSAAIALENIDLKQNVIKAGYENNAMADQNKEMEASMYALAHDLRNPLSTMLLLTELLQNSLQIPVEPRIQGLIDAIKMTGHRANEQINSMLSLYSTSGRTLQKQNVNLSLIAHEIVKEMLPREPNRKISFECESGLTAYADPVLIRIAMENLFANAFKYTSKKAQATIEFRQAPHDGVDPTFLLRDNGDGFEPDQARLLFRPLVRLHTNSEFNGTGLGLASVARIIELHGGRVRAQGVKSEGASFFFSLPNQQSG